MVWGIPDAPEQLQPQLERRRRRRQLLRVVAGGGRRIQLAMDTVTRALIRNGYGSSVVRLGWEFNGGWFPWAAGGCPGAFVGTFQQIVTVMRSVSGANFSFEWNPTAGDFYVGNLADFYPGSSFVNYVGLDVYDNAWASYPGAQSEFHTIKTESDGLDWLSTFAAHEGKAIVLPEWGLGWGVCDAGQPVNAPNNGTCGGDDPTFINDMASWIKSNNVFEDTFWDYGSSSMAGCPSSASRSGIPPATRTRSPTATSTPSRTWSPILGREDPVPLPRRPPRRRRHRASHCRLDRSQVWGRRVDGPHLGQRVLGRDGGRLRVDPLDDVSRSPGPSSPQPPGDGDVHRRRHRKSSAAVGPRTQPHRVNSPTDRRSSGSRQRREVRGREDRDHQGFGVHGCDHGLLWRRSRDSGFGRT